MKKNIRIPNKSVKAMTPNEAKTIISLTPEQKKQLERETGFLMYLTKTKQATIKGREFFVGDTLLSEISPELRKKLYDKYEDEQMLVLEYIMYGQLLVETMAQMDHNYYGDIEPVRKALKGVKNKLTPHIERDFSIVYRNVENGDRGVNESNDILKELEKQAKDMAAFRVPAKAIMSKLNRAFNYENDTMIATADRIIKKHEKSVNGMKVLEEFLHDK